MIPLYSKRHTQAHGTMQYRLFTIRVLLLLFELPRRTVTAGAAASFGRGIDVFGNTDITASPRSNTYYIPTAKGRDGSSNSSSSQISWVCELNGIGLGLCDSKRNAFYVWNTVNNSTANTSETHTPTAVDTTDNNLRSVAVTPLTNPVGAIQSQFEPQLVYIACFGTHPVPIINLATHQSDSGIAIVNISNSEQPVLVQTVAYPHLHMHVHNVYEFDFLQVSGVAVVPEITVAVLGNPWLVPPLPGHGLVQLDRTTGNFRPLVVNEKEDDNTNRLNVRSAKQVAPGIFYAVTQEPAGEATQVIRLEQTTPEAQHTPHGLKIVAQSVLPARDGGDGGADVVLGVQLNTVWISDRWQQAGRLYYYVYHPPAATTAPVGGGTFDRVATHVATKGINARYTVITHTGDIVVCNEGSNTLTVMEGLALHPQSTPAAIPILTIDTVQTVQFFLERRLLPSSVVRTTRTPSRTNMDDEVPSLSSSFSLLSPSTRTIVKMPIVTAAVLFMLVSVIITLLYQKRNHHYKKYSSYVPIQ